MLRAGSPGRSDQRCSRSVIAPGWGNLGLRPKPPFTGSNTRAIWATASSSISSDGSPGAASSRSSATTRRTASACDCTCPRRDAIRVEHALQHGAEARPAVRAVGREVGAAVEHLAGGREERGERPAALPGQRLHRPLIAGVDVRPLVPVHLDADEVARSGTRPAPDSRTTRRPSRGTSDTTRRRCRAAPGGPACGPPRRPRRPRGTSGWAGGRPTAGRPMRRRRGGS